MRRRLLDILALPLVSNSFGRQISGVRRTISSLSSLTSVHPAAPVIGGAFLPVDAATLYLNLRSRFGRSVRRVSEMARKEATEGVDAQKRQRTEESGRSGADHEVRVHRTASTAAAARAAIRCGDLTGHTAGCAPGYVQGNIVILPQEYADHFRRYCELNPQPCPLLAVSEPGDPSLPTLGLDIDIRTDVPRYRIFRQGQLDGEPTDISTVWQEDLVTFVLGCSFSFEQALMKHMRLQYIQRGRNVPMYVTNCETTPSGPFCGKMVVSMRDLLVEKAEVSKAVEVTSRYPRVHGTPVHVGDGDGIGIGDIERPEYGDAPEISANEQRVPVFWACGVTPQVAVGNAKLPFVITHAPGHMLITDILNTSLESESAVPAPVVRTAPMALEHLAKVRQAIDDAILEGDIRGMRTLVEKGHVPRGACMDAADLILTQPRGVCFITTGFYIAQADNAETDGPPGAAALGSAVAALGFKPVYVTDRYSRTVVAACAGPGAEVIVFPITTPEMSEEYARGLLAGKKPTLLLSVERCGKGKDGKYKNMLGQDFSDRNAQIDALFEAAGEAVPSIGVADGGNEIGCGTLTASGAIPGADPDKLTSPACVTRTTKLVVAACSNWGAFGIVAALALRTRRRDLLPSVKEIWALVQHAVNAGAVDGILKESVLSVDGRGEEPNSKCVEKLHDVIAAHL